MYEFSSSILLFFFFCKFLMIWILRQTYKVTYYLFQRYFLKHHIIRIFFPFVCTIDLQEHWYISQKFILRFITNSRRILIHKIFINVVIRKITSLCNTPICNSRTEVDCVGRYNYQIFQNLPTVFILKVFMFICTFILLNAKLSNVISW